jgi:hypothetical protein
MTITDADRLAYGNGTELPLANGRRLQLHYGFGGMRRIETKFPSVIELVQSLITPSGPRYYEAHVVAVWSGTWEQQLAEEEIETLLDGSDIDELNTQLLEALSVALPKLAREAVKAARAEAEKIDVEEELRKQLSVVPRAMNGSPGETTTTSQPSSLAEGTTSSGV